jgi:hypothetical protein
MDKLDYLMSRLDIIDCINRIARGVDRLDRDIFRSGYHQDAILDFGTHIGSPEQHMDFFFDLHAKAQTRTAHTICNHTCEIDGDVAHTETYYIYGSENTSGTPVTVAGGRYVDKFERRDGRCAQMPHHLEHHARQRRVPADRRGLRAGRPQRA